MYSRTLVIIPAYNEGKSISRVVSSIKELYPDISIAVIDDGSTDDTAKRATLAGAIVLSHPFNMGYGTSVQTGYKYAVRKDYSYLVQMDGDGQHDAKGIGDLSRILEDGSSDIVLGSRFLGSNNYRPSIYRLIGISFFRLILRLLSGQRISDPTTGFQAMNQKVLKLFVQDIFPNDYPDADIVMLLSKFRFKIKEVPVVMYPNPKGKSMHGKPIDVLYYIFKMLLSMFVTKLRKCKVPFEPSKL